MAAAAAAGGGGVAVINEEQSRNEALPGSELEPSHPHPEAPTPKARSTRPEVAA